MKKIFLTIAVFSGALILQAQDSNIKIGLSSPAHGVKVNANFPTGTGGWARGFHVADQSSNTFISFGVLGSYDNGTSSFSYGYIGSTYSSPFMVFAPDGDIGIGTTSPSAKLHVNNGDNSYGAILANASEVKFSLYTKTFDTNVSNMESFRLGLKYDTNENNGFISFYRGASSDDGFLGFSTSGTERVRIDKVGNVGIGTDSPITKLDITNGTYQTYFTGNALTFKNSNVTSYVDKKDAGDLRFRMGANLNTAMTIDSNLRVGIGTTNTFGYKLAVNGKVGAKEVKVEVSSAWPDYVFAKEYELPTLKEVENHIKEKGHLQNIPSAEEVKKDGFFLGEMDAKLLQKVEELTLYTIQQEKKLDKQRKEIEELKVLVKQLIEIKK